MIQFLYRTLNVGHRLGRHRADSLNIKVWMLLAGYYWWVNMRLDTFHSNDGWFFITLMILVSGIFMGAYCYLMNAIRCYLNKRLFNRRFILKEGGLVMFTNYPKDLWGDTKSIIGVVSGDSAYIDKWNEDFSSFIMFYDKKCYDKFSQFLTENMVDSSLGDIEKRLVEFRLGGFDGRSN